MIAYHVTACCNLPNILKKGLLPRIGRRAKECREKMKAVYLFRGQDDLETALGNWLGECFDDMPEGALVILEVDIPDSLRVRSGVEYEVAVLDVIGAEAIRRVLNESLSEV
jgi:hypothetical protein